MEKHKKREVPSIMKKILAVDAYLTDIFVKSIEKFLPLRQLKIHYTALEISCHGIPWFALWLAFIWIMGSKDLYQMQINLLLGLIIDIVFVAVLKALARRRRPTVNHDPFAMGPDKFSFPSGHASRCTLIVFFFINLWPTSVIFIPPMLAWSFSVCLSRLLMRRHYLIDVLAGIILGLLEGLLLTVIYLDKETCISLVSYLTDEKVDGADYDV